MTITPLPLTHTIDGVVYTVHPVLIGTAEGNFLVDCGYEETVGQLIEKLREAGVGESALTGLIITHDDHDHMGGAAELKRLIQAENSLDSMPERARGWALVLEAGRLTIANPQYTLDIERANESAQKILNLNAQTVICYHGVCGDIVQTEEKSS